MDQLDSRYKDLREQLYTLGFHQQLPIGSMHLVSALLEDLIKVTDSYKQSKETVKHLLEEKAAWDLGIEPYKCDNSRLLSENNALHLEVIKIRGHYEQKIVDLNNTIRNLEIDKNYLDDHCFELASKIREMEQQRGKNVNGNVMHKKAFISTVRGGTPPLPVSPKGRHHTSRLCDRKLNNEHHVEYIKLQNDIQLLKDETGCLKKQLENRDEEIARLHKQLTGGRPAAALGRDCCYRGIDTLTEDMKLLQQQLIATKKELAESLKQQHEAKHRAILLAEEKSKCANDLRDMEEIALKVEEEANAKLMAKEKHIEHLENKMAESLRKIALLEAGGHRSRSTSQQSKTVQNLKAALKKTNDENDNLIERLINDETKYQEQIKILTRKNTKLEEKLRMLQANDSSKKSEKRLTSKATLTDPQNDNTSKEKMLLQAEYLRRLNQPVYERELENVQAQLQMRYIEINSLKEQLASQQQNAAGHTSSSVQSVMNRMERETETLKLKIEHMSTERDELQKNLQEVTNAYHNEQLSCAEQTLGLSNKIKQLENDNRALRDSLQTGTSIEHRISKMNEEIKNYSQQLDELNEENRKLKASNSQIRMLKEQTEKSLLDYQNRLYETQSQLAQTESERGAIDVKFDFTTKTINNLKMEAAKYKSIIEELEQDRNEMHNLLDTKTEKMCHLEAEISQLRADNSELNLKCLALQRQMSNKSHENVEKTSTIQKVTQETEVLRKQIEHLKGLNENLTTENSRLNNEITDLECACKELKKKERLTSLELIRLEDSVREYVKKIKLLEDAITSKEIERSTMLDHLNELENDANVLERTNRNLEEDNLETKRYLTETEHKLDHLQEILYQRDNEIAASDRQVTQLNNHISEVERELKRREEEVAVVQANADAIKEVCSKLDIEKKKLNEELNEASNIRKQLEEENEKLRKDLAANAALDQQKAVQNLQELLTVGKREVEQLRATVSEKSIEIQKRRLEIKELKEKIQEEHENSKRHEALSQEYSIQIQELRRELTELRHAYKVIERSKEQIQKDEYDRNKKQSKSESQRDIFESHSGIFKFIGAATSKTNTKLSNPSLKAVFQEPLEKEKDRIQENSYKPNQSGSRRDPLQSLSSEMIDSPFDPFSQNRTENAENDRNQILYKQTSSGSRTDALKSPSTNSNRSSAKKSKLKNDSTFSFKAKAVSKSHIRKNENERNKISSTHAIISNQAESSSKTNFLKCEKSQSKIKPTNSLSELIDKDQMEDNQNERNNKILSEPERLGDRIESVKPRSVSNLLNHRKSKTALIASKVVNKLHMEKGDWGSRSESLELTYDSNSIGSKKSKSKTELTRIPSIELINTPAETVSQRHKKKEENERRIDPVQPQSTNFECSTSNQFKLKDNLARILSKVDAEDQKENDENDCSTNSKHTNSTDSYFNAIDRDHRKNEEHIVVSDDEIKFFKPTSNGPISSTMKSTSSDSDLIVIDENRMDKEENDRNKILRAQTTSGSGTDFSESYRTNYNSSQSSKILGSTMNAAEVHSMKAIFRRYSSLPSDARPPVTNPKHKSTDEDSLESMDEVTAMHVHFQKNPNSTKRTSPTAKSTLRKEDNNHLEKKINKLTKRISSKNESKVQLENGYIESVDSSQDTPEVSQMKNNLLDITLPGIQTSCKVNQDKVPNSQLQESSQIETKSRTDSKKESTTRNSSRNHVPGSSSAPRSSLKQSHFDCRHLPPPPPFQRNFTFESDRTSQVIKVVTHIPINTLSYGVTPIK